MRRDGDNKSSVLDPNDPENDMQLHECFLYVYLRFDSLDLALQPADQAVDLGHLSLHDAELVSELAGLHRHLVKLQTEERQH